MKNIGQRTGRTAVLALMITMGLTVFGCSKSDSPVTPAPGGDSFDAIIASGGEFPEVAAEDTVLSEETIINTVGDEEYFCTTTRYSIVEAPDVFPQFNPNAGVVFPGGLLQGESLGLATPKDVPVRRGTGVVVINVVNGSSGVSYALEPSVSFESAIIAQNNIVAANSGVLPANFTYTIKEVRTKEEFSLGLGVKVNTPLGSVGTSLGFTESEEKTQFLVKLIQNYYTMVFQTPTSVEEFFAPDLRPAELEPYVGPGNPAAWIQSVTYGRIFYMIAESSESTSEMSASLNASIGSAVAGAELTAGAKDMKDLKDFQVRVFALGGDASGVDSAAEGGHASLRNFVTGGGIETGAPLSFVVKSVAHRDRTVSVALATEYDVTTCTPVGESFENPIAWFKADGDVATTTNNQVTGWTNSFEPFDVASPASGGSSGRLYYFNGSGSGPAYVSFGGSFGNALAFNGNPFKESDYTIIVAARAPSTSMDYPTHFLFGTNPAPRSGLEAGFRNPNQAMLGHQGPRLDVPLSLPLTSWQVYTFRFSRSEGMKVWINGASEPVAVDPTLTDHLLDFVGARLGSSTGSRVDIAEVKAYGSAISDAQRTWIVDEMLTKYSSVW